MVLQLFCSYNLWYSLNVLYLLLLLLLLILRVHALLDSFGGFS